MKKEPRNENLNFSADVSRLLDIVANALYSHNDVFLRELISNSSDACDRLRYESITRPEVAKGNPELHIRVYKDAKERMLSVIDNGIGMNREELIENLGTIARSGTAAVMDQAKKSSEQADPLKLIGQFGVGFYSCFMVADKATVISRRAGEDTVWHWESDGRTGYSIRQANESEAAKLGGTSGTAIVLHIKAGASDFLIDEKIKLVIQRYSDHIAFPIYLGEKKEDGEEQPVNTVTAIWMRRKNEVTTEQYNEFYHHISYAIDEPLLTAHWRAEGLLEFSALLYIPTMRPWDLYDPSRKNAVKLYVRRVFITDQCESLIYPWLRFLRGVIDSEDLPLNISRENLQFNPVISRIRKAVAKKILTELETLSREDKPAFETFWHQFGAALKEGLYDAYELRPDIFKVTRFYSTATEGLTSLDDYLSRMKEGQDAIYYMSGENLDSLRNSPQTEGFRDRGLEVLFMTDTIDDFWLQAVPDYQGKPFRSITKGSIDLGKFKRESSADESTSEDENRESVAEIAALVTRLAGILKDDVGDVRLSARLSGSPVCLIAAENEADLNLERVLKIHQKYEAKSKRILEINGKHPLILKLAGLKDGEDLKDAAHLLLDQARIIQGEPLPDPSAFSRRMSAFLERGIAG